MRNVKCLLVYVMWGNYNNKQMRIAFVARGMSVSRHSLYYHARCLRLDGSSGNSTGPFLNGSQYDESDTTEIWQSRIREVRNTYTISLDSELQYINTSVLVGAYQPI